ncbi:MAG: MFS transporter [Candidatus Rokuibacteriota bacterium]
MDPRLRRARWLVLAVPSAIYVFSYFHRVAPAVVAGDLMRAFAITAAELGTLAAVYPYVFVAMALVAGSLADTLGPRRTLALGAAGMGAGAVLFGLAPTFSVAIGGRLVVSLGASVVLIAFLALAAEWFRPDEFATVSGLTQTVGNVGGLVAASPLALLVEAVGWRQSFVAIGAVTLALGALPLVAIRDRPEAAGLPRVNPDRRRAPTLREVARGIPSVIANRRTWPPILAAGGVYATLIAFQGLWGVPYLVQRYDLPRVTAATLLSLIAVGLIVGAPLAGVVSDRWLGRRRRPFVASAALYAACWLPLAVPALHPPVALLGPFFFLMGFFSSGLVLVWSCVREVNDPVLVGVAVGFCNAPIFLLFALTQWLTGVILDARWEGAIAAGVRLYPPAAWQAAFGVCLAVAVAGVVAAVLVTETRCRSVWRAGAEETAGS